jgi:hypothetical protein
MVFMINVGIIYYIVVVIEKTRKKTNKNDLVFSNNKTK